MQENRSAAVFAYHERTKHHYDRYARSAGQMDWPNQPEPFRFYRGRPPLDLPFLQRDPQGTAEDLYRRPPRPPAPASLETIGALLELSLGLSAWKSVGGSRWALRMNPSSGNLHPTEAHLVIAAADRVPPGVYHYNPLLHALEPRARIPADLAARLTAEFGPQAILVGLTSIFWRESWKYGERALRYCNHDVGHALAALSVAANLLGWRLSCLDAVSDEQIETVLGLDRTEFPPLEAEHPDLLCRVHPMGAPLAPRGLSGATAAAFDALPFDLAPNRLSRERVDWEVIYRTAEMIRKPETPPAAVDAGDHPPARPSTAQRSGAEIIRGRRSAVQYDPGGRLARDRFLTILDRTLPRGDAAPFDCGLGEPAVNLLIFAHRVDGLQAGLYFFLRCPRDLTPLRRLSRQNFSWSVVEDGFPLFLLQAGDFRREATMVSCHQDIAGNGAASFGMIARFRPVVENAPHRYRHLFWETGMIGQVLYLEAEAHEKRGTGIGCFFDDAVHDLMGLPDDHFQSLYHFTLGDPVEDPRLSTHPPYGHLARAARSPGPPP